MDSSAILMMLNDKLPKDNPLIMQTLNNELKALNDKQLSEVMQKITIANLKSPTKVFWLGSFLFGNLGVGRFMIGDNIIGGVRLALLIIYVLLGGAVEAYQDDAHAMLGASVLAIVFGLAVFIWWVADLFLVGKKLRNINLQKVQEIITSVK
ncbi:hypothetical protein DCO58_00240 [Helicobacter saguini]|uniref:TM2 domain-containing protein n=1 Tax=Helicobacter saguini TaxID=1548018 RepID=A0A347VQS5_9HELI|nr:hypothetical protein [Helicobacter saguini]MWV63178.1 hypothetical protein [Helicobacter saguini]MWV66152.1 hypothetical protein [Helicobacter saguini]MWV68501.1 hypothetical protein [Helicobacter saguini]MWV71944.1 hypothetical protein [Helicobacter saguini]TLD95954.1 hypothetical protein LS64_000915 [Helicobacter saguini]